MAGAGLRHALYLVGLAAADRLCGLGLVLVGCASGAGQDADCGHIHGHCRKLDAYNGSYGGFCADECGKSDKSTNPATSRDLYADDVADMDSSNVYIHTHGDADMDAAANTDADAYRYADCNGYADVTAACTHVRARPCATGCRPGTSR